MFSQKLQAETPLNLKLAIKDINIQFAPNNDDPPHIIL